MKTLWLHIGMPKTGTSSIQQTLGHAAEELRHKGIFYAPWKPFNHAINFAILFRPDVRNPMLRKRLNPISDAQWEVELDRQREKWAEYLDSLPAGTAIISAETLCQFSPQSIAGLLDFVAPCFDEIKAIAYVRNPVSAIQSLWEQLVKDQGERELDDALLIRAKRSMTYEFVEHWSQAMGTEKLVLKVFDPRSFLNSSLIDDFLHAINVETGSELGIEERRSNQSAGFEGTAVLRALNAEYPIYSGGQFNEERGLARRRHLLYEAMSKCRSEALRLDIKFTPDEADALNRNIGLINKYLPAKDAFDLVQSSAEETRLPHPGDVQTEYYVELINQLSLMVDRFIDT